MAKRNQTIQNISIGIKTETLQIQYLFETLNYNGIHNDTISKLMTCLGHFETYGQKRRHGCNLPFCPVCNYWKINKEVAIYYAVYEELTNAPKYPNLELRLLTLELPVHHINATNDMIRYINKCIRKFMGYKSPKNSTQAKTKAKGVSFDDLLLGSSKLMHVGFDTNNNFAVVHVHLIMFLNGRFTGDDRITKEMIGKRWDKAMHPNHAEYHIEAIKNTKEDVISVLKYGMKTLKHDSIVKYPEQFIRLTAQLKGKRKLSHAKCIRKLKAEVKENYKQQQKTKNTGK